MSRVSRLPCQLNFRVTGTGLGQAFVPRLSTKRSATTVKLVTQHLTSSSSWSPNRAPNTSVITLRPCGTTPNHSPTTRPSIWIHQLSLLGRQLNITTPLTLWATISTKRLGSLNNPSSKTTPWGVSSNRRHQHHSPVMKFDTNNPSLTLPAMNFGTNNPNPTLPHSSHLTNLNNSPMNSK